MALTPAVPVDGNGQPLKNPGVTPGVGYSIPQMGPQTADATTGQNIAPTAVSLAAANAAIPANLPVTVQKAQAASTGSVASLAKAFASNNIAGNSIVVVAGCGNGTAMTVADSLGNTYLSAIAAPNSTTFAAQIFYTVNILAGANTVTVTNAGTAASMAVEIYEVSGLLAQVPGVLGQTSINTGTSATPTAPNISGPPNSLAFMGVAVGTAAQAASVTAGTFWNLDSTQNTTTPAGLYTFGAFNQPLAGMGGVQPAATIAGSEPFALAAAVFKPVALGIEGTVSIHGYNYTHITTQTTTLIKTGPGTLHAIIINKPLASGVVEYDDAITNTNAMGIITLPATLLQDGPKVATLDIKFSTGLSITTSGATQDVTIAWR